MREFGIRKEITENRRIKTAAKEAQLVLTGVDGFNVDEINNDAKVIIEELISDSGSWLDDKKIEIKTLFPDLEESELKDAFENGLRVFFKQQYRLLVKPGRNNTRPSVLQDQEYIKQRVRSYVFVFI